MTQTQSIAPTGPLAAEIHQLLTEAFAPTRLEVINDSASHAGHMGDDGTGESHFTVEIESASFAGVNRVMRQRMVNRALGDIPGQRVHALAIRATAPGSKPVPRRIRRAARILLVDGAGRVLLFRFTPSDRPPLWATPGGECDEGESFDAAARRELLEETGIDTDPGPEVARGGCDFLTFDGEPVTGDERYYIVRVADPAINPHALTASEQAVMLEHRWFTPEEIPGWPEVIYPENLSELLVEVGLIPA